MTSFVNTQVQINKSNLSELNTQVTTIVSADLSDNQLVLKIDSFGFSANNITYALMGDKMGYWGFFPAQSGFGIVPIWGFAVVVHSNHPEIKVGEKVFGYLPMASHLVVTADKVTAQSFYDVNQARNSISSVYDQYVRCAADPGYQADKQDWQLNFQPLFMTSFVLDDYVGERITPTTKQVIITSASSKTGYGAAFLLKMFKQDRAANYRVVGLTSAANVKFTQQTGCYDTVLSYEDSGLINNEGGSFVLDFAGNKPLLLSLQAHLAAAMQSMIYIGVTDVKSQIQSFSGDLKGEFFFAPSQVKKRTQEWGGVAFMQKYAHAWKAFSSHIEPLLTTQEVSGVDAIKSLYLTGLQGRFATDKMYVARF
ncbi:DUF2855 family protein [Aliiglaciecola litoralis]|uniref:DUF2855 family protein n=1 Tax=Aliiglaciecola litoralis TaxID=582857 RepID=A0ABP3X4P4_9ALTE